MTAKLPLLDGFRSGSLSEPLSVAIAQPAEHRIVDTQPVLLALPTKRVRPSRAVPASVTRSANRSREPLSELPRHLCARCWTEIPGDRTLCTFCSKRVPPKVVSTPHPECHIRRDLLPLFDLLIQPLTLDEVARKLMVSRSTIENKAEEVRALLGIQEGEGRSGVGRIKLVRMALGADACFCRT